LVSAPQSAAQLEAMRATVEKASRAWDSAAISRSQYEAGLTSALMQLTELDVQVASRVGHGALPAKSGAELRELSGGIRQLVLWLYVH
jgi:hypothetical protein